MKRMIPMSILSLTLVITGCSLTGSPGGLKTRTAQFFHTEGADMEKEFDQRHTENSAESGMTTKRGSRSVDTESDPQYQVPWYKQLNSNTAMDIERSIGG